MIRRNIDRSIAALTAMAFAAACSVNGTSADAEAEPAASATAGASSVTDIAALTENFADSVDLAVAVRGEYRGYNAGDCRFAEGVRSAGLTRSDWLIGSGEACIYVTGGAVPGVDAIDPSFQGRMMTLNATLRVDDQGEAYLEYQDGALAAK